MTSEYTPKYSEHKLCIWVYLGENFKCLTHRPSRIRTVHQMNPTGNRGEQRYL